MKDGMEIYGFLKGAENVEAQLEILPDEELRIVTRWLESILNPQLSMVIMLGLCISQACDRWLAQGGDQ